MTVRMRRKCSLLGLFVLTAHSTAMYRSKIVCFVGNNLDSYAIKFFVCFYQFLWFAEKKICFAVKLLWDFFLGSFTIVRSNV